MTRYKRINGIWSWDPHLSLLTRFRRSLTPSGVVSLPSTSPEVLGSRRGGVRGGWVRGERRPGRVGSGGNGVRGGITAAMSPRLLLHSCLSACRGASRRPGRQGCRDLGLHASSRRTSRRGCLESRRRTRSGGVRAGDAEDRAGARADGGTARGVTAGACPRLAEPAPRPPTPPQRPGPRRVRGGG